MLDLDLRSPQYVAGPRIFVSGLPGYPDNINRASDGGYWIALAGMRNSVMDEAMKIPGLRRRMTRRVPPTNWLFGNLNIGGVLKVDGAGQIRDGVLGQARRPALYDHLDARA